MKTDNYILTLDWIKEHCHEVMGEWNGDESGREEERADTAREILEHVENIEILLKEL